MFILLYIRKVPNFYSMQLPRRAALLSRSCRRVHANCLSLEALYVEPFLSRFSRKTRCSKHGTNLKNRIAVLRNRRQPRMHPGCTDPLLKNSVFRPAPSRFHAFALYFRAKPTVEALMARSAGNSTQSVIEISS